MKLDVFLQLHEIDLDSVEYTKSSNAHIKYEYPPTNKNQAMVHFY